MHPLAADMARQGYCVLPGVYTPDECAAIRSELDGAYEREKRSSRGGQFGSVFHPLLDSAPRMLRFYLKPEILDVLRYILQDDVNLAHTGALLMDESRKACQWHSHDGVYHWLHALPTAGGTSGGSPHLYLFVRACVPVCRCVYRSKHEQRDYMVSPQDQEPRLCLARAMQRVPGRLNRGERPARCVSTPRERPMVTTVYAQTHRRGLEQAPSGLHATRVSVHL